MMVWYVTAPLLVMVAIIVIARHLRGALGALTLREARLLRALPVTSINAMKPGLVKLVGVAKAEQGVMSYYERQPCVVHRRAVTTVSGYKHVGTATYAQTFTSHEWTAIPFQLDDGTGLLWVDPRAPGTRVDYELGTTDEESAVQEQFIRLGDRVTVIGEVEMLPNNEGYRSGGRTVDASQYARFRGPVLLSWRSDEEFLPRLAPPWPAVAVGLFGLAGLVAAAWDGQLLLVGALSATSMVAGLLAMGQLARMSR